MIDRTILKEQLPHGSCKIIALKVGVSQKSISNYLTGKTKSERIENAVLKMIGDLKRDKNQLLKRVYEQ